MCFCHVFQNSFRQLCQSGDPYLHDYLILGPADAVVNAILAIPPKQTISVHVCTIDHRVGAESYIEF